MYIDIMNGLLDIKHLATLVCNHIKPVTAKKIFAKLTNKKLVYKKNDPMMIFFTNMFIHYNILYIIFFEEYVIFCIL